MSLCPSRSIERPRVVARKTTCSLTDLAAEEHDGAVRGIVGDLRSLPPDRLVPLVQYPVRVGCYTRCSCRGSSSDSGRQRFRNCSPTNRLNAYAWRKPEESRRTGSLRCG